MSQPVALLVGGTKILERTVQQAIAAPLVVVGTIEEAMRAMTERPVGLVLLGPTLRRSLAVVSTLRREGQKEPRLIVVYRDDLRDEVKRHMKGKNLADRYVMLSRVAKDLAPAVTELWAEVAAGDAGANEAIDEIGQDALEELPDGATQVMDLVDAGEDEGDMAAAGDEDLPPPQPVQAAATAAATGPRGGEVLGAFDASSFGAGGELDDGDDLEDLNGELEEIDGDDALEEIDAGAEIEEFEEIEALDDAALEELPSAPVAQASPDGAVEELSGDELIEEELEAGDLVEELAADAATLDVEAEVELDAGDLVEELVEDEPLVAPKPAAAASAPVNPAAGVVLPARRGDEAHADDLDGPTEPARRVSRSSTPVHFAPAGEPVVSIAPPVAGARTTGPQAATQAAAAGHRQGSGAQAMFSELSGFMERLQEASALITRLEAENEALRHDVTRLQASARPELDAELQGVRVRLSELQLRLEGAEEARSAAVEARMKADLTVQGRDEDLARVRGELSAAQSRESSLESQLDAKRRIAGDAARSLRAIATLLDG